MKRIILLVEGDGDRVAAPLLLRRILHDNCVYDVQIASPPTKVGDMRKLARPGELEKHLHYANLKEGSAILVLQDCDDACAVESANSYRQRASSLQPSISRPIEVALLVREFETLFLWSAAALAVKFVDYGWRTSSVEVERNWDAVRDAKGELRRMFRGGRGYKELLDQPRLAAGLDLDRLRNVSASFRHLEKCLLRLAAHTAIGTVASTQ